MTVPRDALRRLIAGRGRSAEEAPRRSRKAVLSCDGLEGRVTPAFFGHRAVVHAALAHALSTGSAGSTSGSSSSCASNSALTTALQTLRSDVQAIELASGTTVGELTAIRVAFRTLQGDGLTPSSRSALSSFEDSLVTAYASGGASALLNSDGTPNATLFSQFEALYTSSPTSQQTTDLTAAYTALANAVISFNTQANVASDIAKIGADWTAVLDAGGTGPTTYPYFSLVTGGGAGVCGGPGGIGGGFR
jgi:hypothetical protein